MRRLSRAAIRYAIRRGRRLAGRTIRGRWVAQPEIAAAAIVAGRRVGAAVARNYLKRVVREHFRRAVPPPPDGDWVIILLPSAAQAHADTVRAELTGWFRMARREGDS